MVATIRVDTEAAPTTPVRPIDERCGICLEQGECRTDPRKASCGHEFCLPCLSQALKDSKSREKPLNCIVCEKSSE